ncbi:MAG TPA: gluconate 2-dehydrogenase subunit 3 family protein [Bryobacteraceae bacterium]|nr:gluconate 2-dehydrogenase subunit 3 family protein [Bryobacteraceae bacterium]
MKRRQAIQSLVGIPAVAAMPLPAAADATTPRVAVETPKTPVSVADAVAGGLPRFFSAEELAALGRLAEILLPAHGVAPGAGQVGVAEFLDFLVSQSPPKRAALYRDGLAKLNAEARRRYGKTFADLTAEQAEPVLQPLREPWTYHGPSDPFARFLAAAKEDVFTATVNSREWAAAMSRRVRSAGGLGAYWYPIED